MSSKFRPPTYFAWPKGLTAPLSNSRSDTTGHACRNHTEDRTRFGFRVSEFLRISGFGFRISFKVCALTLCLLSSTALSTTNTPALAPTNAAAYLQAGHQRFAAGDFPAARAEYAKILAAPDSPHPYPTLAHLRIAQSFERAGDLTAAKSAYEKLTAMPGAPAHHVWEARERIRELDRRAAGLPPRDPTDSRTKLPSLPQPALTLHVAPNGKDTNPGTDAQPFATLQRARDEIRKRNPLPSGGVLVLVHGGEYPVTSTFVLQKQDSGAMAAPVCYRAVPGEHPRFTGGRRLTGFRPLTNAHLLARLPESAHGKVVQLKLADAGVNNLLPLELGGFASGRGFKTHPAHELFFNGKAQQLARGPNEGFLRIADVAVKDGTKGYDRQGSKVGKFFYSGDYPSRWAGEPDLLLYGYWFWDWADSYERVASIDTTQRLITLAPPVHNYGFSIKAPFYAINALCELDQPGEWYLDRPSGTLLFYPPTDLAQATIEWSMFPETMVCLDDVSHVRLEGLTWELGSADALQIQGGTNVLLAGCTIRHFAGNAVDISGGRGHGLLSCDIYSFGRGGISLAGGSRKTLTPGGHSVENCEVNTLSRIDHTYTPAILVSGVGQRIAHNHLFDIRSSALRVDGNDHRVEFNNIHDAVIESDDQGGADMWGNATYRGNIYRYNYWHHIGNWRGIGEHPKCGQAGIRLDDAISGTLIYGNVFYRASAGALGFGAVQIHGGKDNIIENNIFADCAAAISFSAWSDARWRDFVKNALADSAVNRDLYLQRYPALEHLLENANANHFWRNAIFRCDQFIRRDAKRSDLADNLITKADPGFAAADQGNFRLAPNAAIFNQLTFAPIPFDEIGLYPDAYRPKK